MNALDSIVRAERKRKCKILKRLFKARDMASKYTKHTLKIKLLLRFFSTDQILYQTIGCLAKEIVDYEYRILGLSKFKTKQNQNLINKK